MLINFFLVAKRCLSPSYKQIRSDSPNIVCFLLMTLPFESLPSIAPSQKAIFPRKISLSVLFFNVNFYFYFFHLISCSCFFTLLLLLSFFLALFLLSLLPVFPSSHANRTQRKAFVLIWTPILMDIAKR